MNEMNEKNEMFILLEVSGLNDEQRLKTVGLRDLKFRGCVPLWVEG